MKHVGTIPFETERLICRSFVENDLNDMFGYWASNPKVQLEYGEPIYSTLAETQKLLSKYINNYQNLDVYRWAIIEKASNKNIGQIAFCRVYSDIQTAEIEYCIGEPFWGKGYASEALAGLIDYTFKHTDFIKLEAYHREANDKSGKVLEKSMMQKTDSVERFKRDNKQPLGEVCYCIMK